MKKLVCMMAAGILLIAPAAFGQAAPAKETVKKAADKVAKVAGPGILHPEMAIAANGGTYEAPMGKMGEKGEVWSGTSMAAGVDGKPQPGKAATVTGEIVDMSCYLQLGKHGDKHAACGKKCILAGQPIGLVAKNGDVYLLMEEEHDPRRDGQTSAFRKAAADHIGHIMEITGTAASHAGAKAIFVQGYVSK
jgi:hypothetical protein